MYKKEELSLLERITIKQKKEKEVKSEITDEREGGRIRTSRSRSLTQRNVSLILVYSRCVCVCMCMCLYILGLGSFCTK